MKNASVEQDCEFTSQQVDEFLRVRPRYAAMTRLLERLLPVLARPVASNVRVEVRLKSVTGFAEKIQRKRDKYFDPVRQFTDLAGARLIVVTVREKAALYELLREFAGFEVDTYNSVTDLERLGTSRFGYRSTHLVVQFRPAARKAVARLLGRRFSPEDWRLACPGADDRHPLKAEIQVRTTLENVWGLFTQNRSYKNLGRLPDSWQRELNGVAAALETADAALGRLEEEMESYAFAQVQRMRPEELASERARLQRLSVLPEVDVDAIALRKARLARAALDWPGVIGSIEATGKKAALLSPEARLELGHALCELHQDRPGRGAHRRGQVLLCRVAGLSPSVLTQGRLPPDSRRPVLSHTAVQAAYWLARSLRDCVARHGLPRQLYSAAHLAEPANPYLLAAHLEHELGAGTSYTALRAAILPEIQTALRVCRNHAAMGLELPDVYFVMGFLHGVESHFADALAAYAKGIRACSVPRQIETALDAVHRLARNGPHELRRHLGQVGVLLELGLAAKALETLADGEAQVSAARFTAPRGLRDRSRTARQSAQTALDGAREVWRKLRDRLLAGGAAEEVGESAGDRSDACPRRLPGAGWDPGSPPYTRPVAIVVGATDSAHEQEMRVHASALRAALAGFRGTIVSGGTPRGLPGVLGDVVADLRRQGQAEVSLVAYLPVHQQAHPAYDQVVRTPELQFDVAQVLRQWREMLIAGVRPPAVRLLGINGGVLAGLEFAVALGLGAKVGAVAGSGRAVDTLLSDPDWAKEPNLVALPVPTPVVLRMFLESADTLTLCGSARALEKLARQMHAEYVRENRHKVDPTVADWPDLRPDIAQSNRSQVAAIAHILRLAGFGLRQAVGARVRFTERELNFMAAMEHERWWAERVESGWKLGPVRDARHKISPYLVPYGDLSPGVQEWDRVTVRRIIERLRSVGIGIYRLPKRPEGRGRSPSAFVGAAKAVSRGMRRKR